jgi:hypothetical protein
MMVNDGSTTEPWADREHLLRKTHRSETQEPDKAASKKKEKKITGDEDTGPEKCEGWIEGQTRRDILILTSIQRSY